MSSAKTQDRYNTSTLAAFVTLEYLGAPTTEHNLLTKFTQRLDKLAAMFHPMRHAGRYRQASDAVMQVRYLAFNAARTDTEYDVFYYRDVHIGHLFFLERIRAACWQGL